MKRKTFRWAARFLVFLNFSLVGIITGSVFIGLLAFVSWPIDEELIREIYHSVEEFVEQYLPATGPRGALDTPALEEKAPQP